MRLASETGLKTGRNCLSSILDNSRFDILISVLKFNHKLFTIILYSLVRYMNKYNAPIFDSDVFMLQTDVFI